MNESAALDYDVCGIGSALVDILVEVPPETVEACGLIKGSMQLMDLPASEAIHGRLPSGRERSGGSAANTIAGLASLGARAGFVGRVAEDRFGEVFMADLASLGVGFGGGAVAGGGATGRCLILVTPDADRTMCTTLGVAAHLSASDLSEEMIAGSAVTYLEGYLWDEPVAIGAIRRVIEVAHGAGRKVALSLSDSFCVDRHRTAWRELVAEHVDVLFGNEAEYRSLTGEDDLETACRTLARTGMIATVTRGERGAWAFEGSGPLVAVEAQALDAVVDTTGAGDLYAAGFLFGLVRGADLTTCAQYGALVAAEVISHLGARPEQDLAALLVGA